MIKAFLCSLLLVTQMLSLSGGSSFTTNFSWETKRIDTTEATSEEISAEVITGFYLDDTNTFWIIDAYGKNVIQVHNAEEKRIPIKETALPSDIVVDDSYLYIYDDLLHSIVLFQKDGTVVSTIEIPIKTRESVLWMKQTTTSILLQTSQNRTYVVDKITHQIQCAGFILETLSLPDYDYVYLAMTDCSEYKYYVAGSILKDTSVLAGEVSIIKTDKQNVPIGYYTIPTLEVTGLSDTFFQIAKDGTCYLLFSYEETYIIKPITFAEAPYTYKEELLPVIMELDKEYQRKASRYPKLSPKLSLEEVEQNAFDIVDYAYIVASTNAEVIAGVEIPKEILYQLDYGSSDYTYYGIPYCWGGCNGLSSKGSVYGTFPQGLKNGKNAGNTDTKGYLKGNTCGLDCSGYISVIYELSEKKNTAMLLGLGEALYDSSKLSSMDLLLAPSSHVILFHDWIAPGFIATSETAVLEGKTIYKTRSLNSFLIQGCYQMRDVK